MHSPSALAGMRLGLHPGWVPPVVAPRTAAVIYPSSYSRIIETPRVSGENTTLPDCFPTACVNAVQGALARAGDYTPIDNSIAVAAFAGMTGQDPTNPDDVGTYPDQGFAWWKTNPIAGFKLDSYTPLDISTENEIRGTISFGSCRGVLLCINLSIENQNQRMLLPVGVPGTWGGHAIWADTYDGAVTSVTSWGDSLYIDRSYFAVPGFVTAAYQLELSAVH